MQFCKSWFFTNFVKYFPGAVFVFDIKYILFHFYLVLIDVHTIAWNSNPVIPNFSAFASVKFLICLYATRPIEALSILIILSKQALKCQMSTVKAVGSKKAIFLTKLNVFRLLSVIFTLSTRIAKAKFICVKGANLYFFGSFSLSPGFANFDRVGDVLFPFVART